MDDSGGIELYKPLEKLVWSNQELHHGKLIKIKNFPKSKKVKLFRVTVSIDRTDYVATNDLTQNSTDEVQQVNAIRWKIEEFHREVKQITGIEACQCRKARIQRNHIACAVLVWNCLKKTSYQSSQTVYQLKQGWLSGYLIEQLKCPSVPMQLV